eukprot:406403-Rhodomonas_salina.1
MLCWLRDGVPWRRCREQQQRRGVQRRKQCGWRWLLRLLDVIDECGDGVGTTLARRSAMTGTALTQT